MGKAKGLTGKSKPAYSIGQPSGEARRTAQELITPKEWERSRKTGRQVTAEIPNKNQPFG